MNFKKEEQYFRNWNAVLLYCRGCKHDVLYTYSKTKVKDRKGMFNMKNIIIDIACIACIIRIVYIFCIICIVCIWIPYRICRGCWRWCIPRQVGPTCGFYAVCYAVYKGDRKKLKSESRKAVEWAIKEGLSELGEIFDIEVMQQITKEFYKRESKIVDFVPEKLESLLEKYYVIFPYQANVPHYCCIKKMSGNRIYAYNGNADKIFGSTKYKKNKLFPKNNAIGNEYSWEEYVKKNSSFLHRGLRKNPVNFISPTYVWEDCKFYKRLRDKFYEKAEHLLELKTTPVNMSGKILLIEK